MEEDRELMARNPLFLAVTRPALFAGVPIEAAVVVLLASVITLIGTSNPVYGAVVAAVMRSRAISRIRSSNKSRRRSCCRTPRDRGVITSRASP